MASHLLFVAAGLRLAGILAQEFSLRECSFTAAEAAAVTSFLQVGAKLGSPTLKGTTSKDSQTNSSGRAGDPKEPCSSGSDNRSSSGHSSKLNFPLGDQVSLGLLERPHVLLQPAFSEAHDEAGSRQGSHSYEQHTSPRRHFGTQLTESAAQMSSLSVNVNETIGSALKQADPSVPTMRHVLGVALVVLMSTFILTFANFNGCDPEVSDTLTFMYGEPATCGIGPQVQGQAIPRRAPPWSTTGSVGSRPPSSLAIWPPRSESSHRLQSAAASPPISSHTITNRLGTFDTCMFSPLPSQAVASLCPALVLPQCEIWFAEARRLMGTDGAKDREFDVFGLSGKPQMMVRVNTSGPDRSVSISQLLRNSPVLASVHISQQLDTIQILGQAGRCVGQLQPASVGEFVLTGEGGRIFTFSIDEQTGQLAIGSRKGNNIGTAAWCMESEFFSGVEHLGVLIDPGTDTVLVLACVLGMVLFGAGGPQIAHRSAPLTPASRLSCVSQSPSPVLSAQLLAVHPALSLQHAAMAAQAPCQYVPMAMPA